MIRITGKILCMNFLSMDYFIMVAKEHSFTKAAKRLGITQQTLSAHIASLEREVGCDLFVRHVPLELTYAGETFLRYATDFQHDHTMMMQEFDDIAHDETGILRVAVAHTRERTIMPRIIAAYQRKRPGIMVDMIEGANEQHARRLVDGEVDIAIAHFDRAPVGVELVDFYNEEMVLIVSNRLWMSAVAGGSACGIGSDEAERRIAQGDCLPLKDCPFILGQPDDIDGHIAAELFRRAGFRPQVKARSGNLQTALALTQLGVGASLTIRQFLDEMLDDEARRSLRVLPIGEDARYAISFGVRRQSYQWSAITDFIQVAREILAS
nr:LysR family transcriptional regulator [Bifidobacterium dentium]